MVQMYTVAGRQVGSHILAMATLGTTGGGIWLAMRGSGKKKDPAPPINAGSEDEEKFIKEFIQQANMEEAKAKH